MNDFLKMQLLTKERLFVLRSNLLPEPKFYYALTMLKGCNKFVQSSQDLKLKNYLEDNYYISKMTAAVVGHIMVKATSQKNSGRDKEYCT